MTTPKPQSFQLPDILTTVSSLELRANKNCNFASQKAQQWVLDSAILTETEQSTLVSNKIGLLMALCFPTCDAPQLKKLTEVSTLLLYSNLRVFCSEASTIDLHQPDLDLDGFGLLKAHPLLKHLLDSTTNRLILDASPYWRDRFSNSVKRYFQVQQQALVRSFTPTLEEYMELREALWGQEILLLFAELLETFSLPTTTTDLQASRLLKLKEHAFNVILWSCDVLSYQRTEATSRTVNLVVVLIQHGGYTPQGAINVAGNMIKEAFIAFKAVEETIFDIPESNTSSFTSFLPSWLKPTTPIEETPSTEEKNEVKRYIQALNDFMIGTVNWVYETELFFGKKGAEVRSFGWVFTRQD